MDNQFEIKYSSDNKLFTIYLNNEEIHKQKVKPDDNDILEALRSDNWDLISLIILQGKTLRVSSRVYWKMFRSAVPIKKTNNSFYCSVPYSKKYHYFFYIDEDYKMYCKLQIIE